MNLIIRLSHFMTKRCAVLRSVGGLVVLLVLLSTSLTYAQENENAPLQISFSVSEVEISPGMAVDLIIEVINTGSTSINDYIFLLYATEGLARLEDKQIHNLYDPLLIQTLSLKPGETTKIIVPLYVFENATSHQGIALIYRQNENSHPGKMIARLELSITGAPPPIKIQANYNMPTPPNVTCSNSPNPSYVGSAVMAAIAGGHYSASTTCNKFSGDWILDVPNVTTGTISTSAEQFYTQIANLITQTNHIFSMSTLTFDTHNQTSADQNLVKYYLAPAIRSLHDEIPIDGPYPLLRFAYSPPDDANSQADQLEEVYQDLIFNLPNPDVESWRVNIAVAGIGKFPDNPNDIDDYFPWNHSKVAVSDYKYAIVGGMNWDLDYVNPVDVDNNGVHEPTIEIDGKTYTISRLHDLSIKLEGEGAKEAGVFFDLLWRRNIDPLFPHLNDDCIVSWDISILWSSDCTLDAVPDYAPDGIPDYSVSNSHWVFGLGRGNQGWGIGDVDHSADEAILAAFGVAQESIYVSQHQLSNPLTGNIGYEYADEVIDALVKAIVDNNIQVKIILSEPWGSLAPDGSIFDVYTYIDNKLFVYAQKQYGWDTEVQQYTVYNALCRLEFGPFRISTFNSENHIFYTHNKFFMVDEKSFYIGSQNLYPSGFRIPLPDVAIDLNEYGYLIDDVNLATQFKQDYWSQIWGQIETDNLTFRSNHLPDAWQCASNEEPNTFLTFLPIVSRQSGATLMTSLR